MISGKLIENFFEDQFGKYGPGYSYTDHQLLKENKVQEFFDQQLARTRKRFFYGFPLAIACFIIGLYFFWLFTETFSAVELVSVVFWIMVGGVYLYWISKQYFIIKSSAWLIDKMHVKDEN